ncbi:MAG: acylase [Variovorax sp.]|nr:MAG: acylase [Variovorax sp.]
MTPQPLSPRRRPTDRRGPLFPCVGLLVAALTGCATTPPAEGVRSVTIERTTHGIAHVTAPDHEGLAYGTAYAHAQDNVCQTAEHLLTVRGERSLFLGPQAMGDLGLGRLSNAQIDLFVRQHMDDAALARAAEVLGPDARAALRGYVAGYNRHLSDVGPGGLPEACRDRPWVRPMTQADLSRATELSMIQGGLGALAGAVLAARPPPPATALGAAPVDERPVAPREAAAEIARHGFDANPEGGERGSNGWAFGRDATPDGRGVLLGNPHFPWNGINRFWQLHLAIPGQLDVMGATGGLSPVVAIGFNKDVAWTHTVSTGKRFTLYELALDPADPTVYLVDGQPRKMVARTVEVPLPGGTTLRQTFYATDWGPVIALPRAGLGWSTQKAYALRDANTLNVRAIESWMRMARARNVPELREAMGNQGMPWINTIAADRDGRAMYADLSVVPDVSADQLRACAPSPAAAALFNAAGLPVLDGSRGACAWRQDPSAAAPGRIPPARMPVLVTTDWVQNSNDGFWLANPDVAPMADVSPLVGPVGTPQRLRTRSGILEIRARLAGTDGLPGNRMGADEVRSMIFRDRNLAGTLVMDDLVAACGVPGDAGLSADQATGCRVLADWNRTSDAGARGAPLFREFWRRAKDVPKVWRVPFDPRRPVTTPTGLDMATSATREAVFKALGDAVAALRAAGYTPEAALGEAQWREVRGRRVPLHGGDEFEGVLNKLESQGQPGIAPGGYRINYGTSYLQVVTFDGRGPVAQGLLTYGQSSDPASPRAYDQLPLFAARRWVTLPFHPEDVRSQREGPPLRLAY